MMKYLYYLSKSLEVDVFNKVSIKSLAQTLEISERYMQRILKDLETEGYIDVLRGNGRGNLTEVKMKYSRIEITKLHIEELQKHNKTDEILSFIKKEDLMNNSEFQFWFHTEFFNTVKNNDEKILRISLPRTELKVSPVKSISRHDAHFSNMIHDTLFKYDKNNKEYIKNLVFHVEENKPKEWTFYLKRDLTFHNNTVLRSQDVEWSFGEALKGRKDIFRDYSFKILDDYTFVIQADETTEYMKGILSYLLFSIVPKNSRNHQIGCGPFRLMKFTDESIYLKKFNHYHTDKPWLDGIEGYFNEDERFHSILRQPINNIQEYKKVVVHPPGFKYILFNSKKLDREERFRIRQNIDFKDLVNKDEYLINERKSSFSKISKPRTLKIGVQEIRENVNHHKEGLILKRQLENAGFKCEVTKVFSRNKNHLKELDIFIGGIFILDDKNFSYLLFLNSLQDRYNGILSADILEKVSKRPHEESIEKFVKVLFDELEEESVLLRIATREYSYYFLENDRLKNVEVKNTGLIDFEKLILI